MKGFSLYNIITFNHACLARKVLFSHVKTQDFSLVWFVVSFLEEAIDL